MFRALEARWRRTVRREPDFQSSGQYWQERYALGGNSGAGSYNRLASFKADIINHFVQANKVSTVVELGCGDGEQLRLARYERYIGVDVSPEAVRQCRAKFSTDDSKRFMLSGEPINEPCDVALSLDVIYHLVEDAVYESYMQSLFDIASRFVIIYASNKDELTHASHVRHRRFSDWIASHRPSWELISQIPNRFPFDPRDEANTSFADFYIFARRSERETAPTTQAVVATQSDLAR